MNAAPLAPPPLDAGAAPPGEVPAPLIVPPLATTPALPATTMSATASPTATAPPTGASASEDDGVRARAVTSPSVPLFDLIEKLAVYLVCIGVLIGAGLALHRTSRRAQASYEQVVSALVPVADARDGHDSPAALDTEATVASAHRLSTTVAVLGMRDLVGLRSAVMFIGFIISIMGCVLCLKGVEAMYRLRLQVGDQRATLATASPGLVLITAGVTLVLFALRQESSTKLALTPVASASPTTSTDHAGESAQSGQDVMTNFDVHLTPDGGVR